MNELHNIVLNCIFCPVTVHVTKVLPPAPSQTGGGVVLKSLNEKCCVERRQWAALKSLFIIHN